jgi:succinate-semialdehyde dehydrogenase/glutarate-semialdehyde dehydrogenase
MHNFIAGQMVPSASGDTLTVYDPATDEPIGTVAMSGTEDVQAAVEAAADAQPAWAALSAKDRSRALRRLVAVVERKSEELAQMITAEQGKPLTEARAEVAYGLGFLEVAADLATQTDGDVVPSWNPAKRILVVRQPVGVTAAITPWNFPLAMITRKLGPALAAGCTQVLKPAPQTPLTAGMLCELVLEAEIPAGVVNLVMAPGPVFSGVVFADPRVRKVSFTGSTSVGQELIHQSATNVTRLSLELGGHAPVIVLDDADVDDAVTGAIHAKFRNAGQSCIAANRFYIARPLFAKFCARFADAAEKLTVRPGREDGDLGPLIDDAAVAKVRAHVEDAVGHGAELVCGGDVIDVGPGLTRRFFAPTVLVGVDDEMVVSTEETFGPVAGITSFDTVDEVILRANASRHGLASYVFGRDMNRLFQVAESLECGIVGVNDGLPSTAAAPFGGVKSSGIGREGGRYVMDEYLETKYMSLGLRSP